MLSNKRTRLNASGRRVTSAPPAPAPKQLRRKLAQFRKEMTAIRLNASDANKKKAKDLLEQAEEFYRSHPYLPNSFYLSLRRQFDTKGYLTSKQYVTLNKVLDKKYALK